MSTLLFDLDGTLIDHFSAIHRACAHAARELALPEPDYRTVRTTVGGSVPVTLGRLFGEDHVAAALPLFRAHFESIMLEDVAALPGAEWILDALHRAGHRLAVFTNKDEGASTRVLAHLGLDARLDAVVGTGSVAWRKPQPEFTRHALDRLGSDGGDARMIGDSPFDQQAADACGIPALLVATGSHSREQLAAETGNPAIYDDLFQLGEAAFGLEHPTAG